MKEGFRAEFFSGLVSRSVDNKYCYVKFRSGRCRSGLLRGEAGWDGAQHSGADR